jgi:hypothetical protein
MPEVNSKFGSEGKSFSYDTQWKNGKIQEKLLQKWSLFIYNIEYTQIHWKEKKEENPIILFGSSDFPFDQVFLESLNRMGRGMDDIESFEIIERKRDENGNVIKENRVIEPFQRFMQMEEDERIARSQEGIGGYPLPMTQIGNISDLLHLTTNIFSGYSQPVVSQVEEVEERNPEELNARVDEEIGYLMNTVNEYVERRRNGNRTTLRLSGLLNTESDFINRIERDILREIRSPFMRMDMPPSQQEDEEESKEEEEETKEEDTEEDSEPEVEVTIGIESELDGNLFNRVPLIRSRQTIPSIFQNSSFIRVPIQSHHQDILNNPINMNMLSGIMTNLFGEGHFEVMGNQQTINEILNPFGEDVKVVISEEEFEEKLQHSLFQDLQNQTNTDCTICTEVFQPTDQVILTSCGHIFHRDCIKPWLCNESTKCPSCRKEIIKGHPKS